MAETHCPSQLRSQAEEERNAGRTLNIADLPHPLLYAFNCAQLQHIVALLPLGRAFLSHVAAFLLRVVGGSRGAGESEARVRCGGGEDVVRQKESRWGGGRLEPTSG